MSLHYRYTDDNHDVYDNDYEWSYIHVSKL